MTTDDEYYGPPRPDDLDENGIGDTDDLDDMFDFDDDYDEDDDYKDLELAKVIDLMARDYPGTVDYDFTDDNVAVLYNSEDNPIATITEKQLTAYWNAIETDLEGGC